MACEYSHRISGRGSPLSASAHSVISAIEAYIGQMMSVTLRPRSHASPIQREIAPS
jgi:hypothetical protein